MSQINGPDFSILLAAIESNYFKADDYDAWATELIQGSITPSEWMCKLAVGAPREQVVSYLYQASIVTRQLNTIGHDEIVLGFYLLRYEKGELSLSELLKEAFDLSDSSDSLEFTPEDVAIYLKRNSFQEKNEKVFLQDCSAPILASLF